jgi:hypothetical protein
VEGDETASQEEADDPGEDDDASALATPSTASSASPQEAGLVPSAPPARPAEQTGAHGGESTAEPALQILPLGSGLVLIGLGLGLAFVALRVRRG